MGLWKQEFCADFKSAKKEQKVTQKIYYQNVKEKRSFSTCITVWSKVKYAFELLQFVHKWFLLGFYPILNFEAKFTHMIFKRKMLAINVW